MRVLAAAVLALSGALFAAACVQETEPGEGPVGAEPTTADEPTGEAREPLPVGGFNPSEFPFVTVVKDDGKDAAGGWQQARAKLNFWAIHLPPRRLQCTITVGVPIRAEFMGRISPQHAAEMSAEVATRSMAFVDWDLPQVTFCQKFAEGMRGLFSFRYPKLGAKVTQ